MKKELLVLAIPFLIFHSACGQSSVSSTPELTKDFGFNTAFIFQGLFQSQNSAPFSLMYKRYDAPNKALRIGLFTSFSLRDTKIDQNTTNTNFIDYSMVNIELTIGRETQKELLKKWTWYYGGDVAPGYTYSHTAAFDNGQKNATATNSGYSLSARPFLGIRFAITRQLYLSAEATAQLTYSIGKDIQKSYNPEQITRDATTNSMNFSINPASGIFVFYRF